MTQTRLSEAAKAGQDAKDLKDLVYVSKITTKQKVGMYPRPFDVVIVTPFGSAAMEAFNAKKDYKDFAPSTIPEPQDQVVIVRADPADSFGGFMALSGHISENNLASVSNVVVRRGKEIIRPTQSQPHTLAFSNALGREAKAGGGTFCFPVAAFDPSKGPIEIVVIPVSSKSGDEAVKKLSRKDLEEMP
jgi:hypothetical protein